jgi:hypothetical protein
MACAFGTSSASSRAEASSASEATEIGPVTAVAAAEAAVVVGDDPVGLREPGHHLAPERDWRRRFP